MTGTGTDPRDDHEDEDEVSRSQRDLAVANDHDPDEEPPEGADPDEADAPT